MHSRLEESNENHGLLGPCVSFLQIQSCPSRDEKKLVMVSLNSQQVEIKNNLGEGL